MTPNEWLNVFLILLVVLLVARLIVLTRQRKSEAELDTGVGGDIHALFSKAANSASIQQVASTVSDLLVKQCHCESIVFLRKKRGALELNYYFQLSRFNRDDFRLKFSRDMVEQFKDENCPRPISELGDTFPENFKSLLGKYGLTHFFPICFRGNLYGIYFIKPQADHSLDAIKFLSSVLAYTLSSSYHFKWFESRIETLEGKLVETTKSIQSEQQDLTQLYNRVMQLMSLKDSDKLIVRAIEEIKNSLELTRLAFLYEPKNSKKAALIVRGESKQLLRIPSADSLKQIIASFSDDSTIALKELAASDHSLKQWVQELESFGLTHVTLFRLNATRTGLLAWSGKKTELIADRLSILVEHIQSLTANAESYEKIEEMSFTDPLTGLANKRYFERRLSEEISRCRRYKRNLGLIFFDMDDLKGTNDRLGHLAGDDLLRQMGDILRASIRSNDVVARYGGDEFCVIMPESDEATCIKFMDRLQKTVAESEFRSDTTTEIIRCTISQGAAVFPDHSGEPKALIHAADMALLEAKASGRNRYLVFEKTT